MSNRGSLPFVNQRQFCPSGILALEPKAFGQVFDLFCSPDETQLDEDGTAVVHIRGPLVHRSDLFCDSYEAIKARVSAAIDDGAKRILMSIDSPGGELSGTFDTARALRKMTQDAGVILLAQVDSHCTSAAYALATAASWIGVSSSSEIGSIGIIAPMVDASMQNQMRGINVQLVVSGERKSDGASDIALTPEALDSTQQKVDALAEMFFSLVVEHGWGKSVAALRDLQAGLVLGDEAVAIGLASEIATFDETLAFAGEKSTELAARGNATEGIKAMSNPMEDAVVALRAAAEGEDEEQAKKAKAALAALDESEEESAEDESEEEEATDESEEESAEDESEEESAEDEDKPEDKKGAKASAESIALKALSEGRSLRARIEKSEQDAKRKTILASRPDLTKEEIKLLGKVSVADVRKYCATAPRNPMRKEVAAAAATATSTIRGEHQNGQAHPRLGVEAKAKLDRAMGLVSTAPTVVNDGVRMSFGVHQVVAPEGK